MAKMTNCKACGKEIAKGAKLCPSCGKDQRSFFGKHKIITGIAVIIVLIIIVSAVNGGNKTSTTATSSTKAASSSNTTKADNSTTQAVKQRQVTGKATDLGAGTFTGGKDIPVGLYDATSLDGSGNFTVNASSVDLKVNEILGVQDGQGVAKVRVKIENGDQIQLQGINKTHFEPVTAPFATSSQTVNIYSGSWTVGEDIVKGRYNASTANGGGNFVVYDSNGLPKTNEILGDGGVKQVTVDLNDGDIVTVASLNQVTLTPTK
ncbi:hypothetical protein SAMN02745134_01128 [Clostridium acidisoli DSM 12555]|uniref:Zinc-ribbon domain-containing protein n=1 Tax=Clostridium acidisoli DSM 12555 TaxID=1121291 RepID=A0A1W1XAA8_9CLOT|nr:zinc ribbon domain-containing protein [Clostridium acidisoli]SMC20876.1 hypothetical protein SAMN02745134_01128 [Clostridium acidisoli DSM 12555]